VKGERFLRTAGFEQRARNMGITEKGLVAEKVAIWEGMHTAEQSGDGTGVTILYSAVLEASAGLLLIEGETKVLCLGSLGYLYRVVGPSPNSVSTHKFLDMDHTNISKPTSCLLTAPPKSVMPKGITDSENLMHLFLSLCG